MADKNEVLKKAKERFMQCRQNGSGGSNAPGNLALEEYPQMLRELAENIKTVVVTGTNGKTTTVGMMTAMLNAAGAECFSNSTGANIDSGICTAFIMNTDDNGQSIKKTAILECDEKYLNMICREINPEVIVITNITDDQKDRLGTADDVKKMFLDCILKTDATVCINEKCPLSQDMKKELKDRKTVLFSGETDKIFCNGCEHAVRLNVPGDYNYSNAAAAFAGAAALTDTENMTPGKIDAEKMIKSLLFYKLPFGRMETFSAGEKSITINLVKNKVGAEVTLLYIESLKKDYKTVLGFNSNSEDGRDSTWLDSIDFNSYRKVLADTVVFGDNSEKTAEILKKEGIVPTTAQSFEELFEIITADEKPVFMLLNYSCMMNVRKHFADMGRIKNFWEE